MFGYYIRDVDSQFQKAESVVDAPFVFHLQNAEKGVWAQVQGFCRSTGQIHWISWLESPIYGRIMYSHRSAQTIQDVHFPSISNINVK